MVSENKNTKIWVSEFDSKRVVFDEQYKTAILDQNDESLEVNSLNYTFINDYFDNSNQSFKYLGEEKNCYKIKFKEGKNITIIYIGKSSNIVEKMIQNAENFEFITEFKVRKNVVSKEDVEFPNLDGYRAYDSVNSRPIEDSEKE